MERPTTTCLDPSCPDDETLHAYLVGDLSADRIDAVFNHIEDFAPCQNRFRLIQTEIEEDPLVQRIRGCLRGASTLAATVTVEYEMGGIDIGFPVGSPFPREFGKFTLLEEVGDGGMGIVYKVRYPANRIVALKQIRAGAFREQAAARTVPSGNQGPRTRGSREHRHDL